jgi:hypothetical protein
MGSRLVEIGRAASCQEGTPRRMARDAVDLGFCYTGLGKPVRSGIGDIEVEREQ